MLELRPSCEHCETPLPPSATQARICSFECTFCADCVERVLGNVCPNCGGGFTARPIRPAHEWKEGNYLGACPASSRPRHRRVDSDTQTALRALLEGVAPERR